MRTFVIKLINLVLICAVLLSYQIYTGERSEEIAAYNNEKLEAEQAWKAAEEKKLLAEAAALAEEGVTVVETQKTETVYEDGTYQGSGTGFGGEIIVEIEIAQDEIVYAGLVAADNETPEYLESAMKILDDIVANKTTDVNVDVVSGATLSSNGILEGVRKALEQAQK